MQCSGAGLDIGFRWLWCGGVGATDGDDGGIGSDVVWLWIVLVLCWVVLVVWR